LVRNQAITEVEKAFTAYNVSREKLRLFTDGALNTASDVRRIEEIAYRDGAKGLLDYLDAQRTYNQTVVDYNQARFDFLMSLYQLEMATGTTIVK
jgi:outer membrane protein, heavy metal efflux system